MISLHFITDGRAGQQYRQHLGHRFTIHLYGFTHLHVHIFLIYKKIVRLRLYLIQYRFQRGIASIDSYPRILWVTIFGHQAEQAEEQ